MAKFWVVKYWSTRGIFQESCRVPPLGHYACDSEIRKFDQGQTIFGQRDTIYYFGRDAFETKEEAIAAVLKLRERKIASLKRQIAKLEAIDFHA